MPKEDGLMKKLDILAKQQLTLGEMLKEAKERGDEEAIKKYGFDFKQTIKGIRRAEDSMKTRIKEGIVFSNASSGEPAE